MKTFRLFSLLCAAILGMIFVSCKAAEEPNRGKGGGVNTSQTKLPDNIDFKSESSSKTIQVGDLPQGWRAQSDQSWCSAKPQGKILIVEVQTNDDTEIRQAKLTISSSAGEKYINVRQLGTAPAILVDKQIFTIPASGGPIDFVITTNTQIEVKLPEWVKSPSELKAMRKESHSYVALSHTGESNRVAKIEIVQKGVADASKAVRAFISLTQLGAKDYVAGSTESLADDEQVKVVSGQASSFQPNGGEIEKSFDGDMNTLYHSNWTNTGKNYFPITLTYNFAELSDVDYLVYYPRTSGQNGNFKEVDIEVSQDGMNFEKLVSKDFGGSSQPTRVIFDRRLQAKSFRFIVRSGVGDREPGFASCAEMMFFKRSSKSFDYKTLFADDLCTTLRSDITDAKIAQCTDPFFRNLAFFIKQGKYNQEFRVASFKPYLHPNVMATRNKTNPYSLLDNPTGISVKKGEDLIVFVEDTHGFEGLSLRVQNLDKPGGDGFGGEYYPLYKGMNKLKMRSPGLAYVMYHTMDEAQLASLHPLRMHFATGTVNGYYNSQDPKLSGRWKELLGKATDKYFDVLGKYAHLTFETANFRNYTPEGRDITNTYDSIVRNEWVLHGYYKYNCTPKNRMYLHVMYHAFMYATWYHTAYEVGTAKDILDPAKMRNPLSQGAAWGPSHEIGHMNQIRPGLLWHGMTECTVNIPSEYITTYVFKQPSRLQDERMGDGNNRYSLAFSHIIAGETPFCTAGSTNIKDGIPQGVDVFKQLVPFWQLELYFGRVLGNSPRLNKDAVSGFYPDLYEYFRRHNSPETPGTQQAEFAYAASKVAGRDLTRYFERWGFFRAVNTTIDDYGKRPFVLTDVEAHAVKNRIASLKLQNIEDLALEYITDDNAYLYKDKPSIIEGNKPSISSQSVKITGWKNVVAFEVYNAQGKLIFVADATYPKDGETHFYLSSPWAKGNTIKAVSAGNIRVIVPTN